jgi:hypothetical protein
MFGYNIGHCVANHTVCRGQPISLPVSRTFPRVPRADWPASAHRVIRYTVTDVSRALECTNTVASFLYQAVAA